MSPPWVVPAVAHQVVAQDAALSPTLQAALRQVATATVTGVVLSDDGDPANPGFTVSATTSTVSNGGPPTAAVRYLEVRVAMQPDGTWRVDSVTQ